jgi:hypothetical protein
VHRAILPAVALTLIPAACNQASSEPLKIDAADATCRSDADCWMTMTHCSCDCGAPINRAHWQKYLDAQERMCKNYRGMMCKMACNDTVICDKGVCRVKK